MNTVTMSSRERDQQVESRKTSKMVAFQPKNSSPHGTVDSYKDALPGQHLSQAKTHDQPMEKFQYQNVGLHQGFNFQSGSSLPRVASAQSMNLLHGLQKKGSALAKTDSNRDFISIQNEGAESQHENWAHRRADSNQLYQASRNR